MKNSTIYNTYLIFTITKDCYNYGGEGVGWAPVETETLLTITQQNKV